MAPCLQLPNCGPAGGHGLSGDAADSVDHPNCQLSSAEQQRYELLRAVPRQVVTVASAHRSLLSLTLPGVDPRVPGHLTQLERVSEDPGTKAIPERTTGPLAPSPGYYHPGRACLHFPGRAPENPNVIPLLSVIANSAGVATSR